MPSGYSHPTMLPAQIAEALTQYGIAPVANLRPEDIANPQAELLPAVLSRFIASFVDTVGEDLDGEDAQLGFTALEALDNPEHHAEGIRVLRLYEKARAFLESIQFKGFTLADLLRPHPVRVVKVLSALVNFLFYREEKLNLLHPIVSEAPDYHERSMELMARIAQLQKEIADHELAEQMEEPIVQQLESEVNGLQLKAQAYNKQQLALRAKEGILSKTALEEKKSAHTELKNSEKMAIQNVQEKSATLEIYNKVAAAKTVEREVKALKAKLNDESVSIMSLDAKIVEWQGRVHEAEERLKDKVKEQNHIIVDENQKLSALRSEIECKLQCLEPGESEVEAKITKASNLCVEADSARTAATAEQRKIRKKFDNILQAFNCYMYTLNPFLEPVEEVGKETPQRQLAGDGISVPGPSEVATKTTPRANA